MLVESREVLGTIERETLAAVVKTDWADGPVHHTLKLLVLGAALRNIHCSSSSHAYHASCIRGHCVRVRRSLGRKDWSRA